MTICGKKTVTWSNIRQNLKSNHQERQFAKRLSLTKINKQGVRNNRFQILQKQRKTICKVVTWNWSLQNFQENGLQRRVCKMTHNGNLQNNLQQHLANNDLGRQLEKRVVWNENLPNLQKNNYKHDFPKRFNKRTNAKFLMFSWSSLTLLSPSTHCQA